MGRRAPSADLVLARDGQQSLGDAVLAALVVDEAVGAELAQRQEARTRQETLATDVAAACRQVGQQRQAWEVVARQETLAGQIAVGVEVAVEGAVAGQQQVTLLASLVVALLGFAPLTLARSGVVLDLEVQFDGLRGGTVQVAPALQRAVELAGRRAGRRPRPMLGEPGRGRGVSSSSSIASTFRPRSCARFGHRLVQSRPLLGTGSVSGWFMSSRSRTLLPRRLPVSASQMACMWLLTSSRLARSSVGALTCPCTMRTGSRK